MKCPTCHAESCEHVSAIRNENPEPTPQTEGLAQGGGPAPGPDPPLVQPEPQTPPVPPPAASASATAERDKKLRRYLRDYRDVLPKLAAEPQKDVHIHIHNNAGAITQMSILEYLDDLPAAPMTSRVAVNFDTAELRVQAEALRMARLLLISCEDMGLALTAATAVANNIGVPPDRRKLLDLHKHSSFTIDQFKERVDPSAEVAVVIDAFHDSGQGFIDSIFSENAVNAFGNVGRDFSEHGLSLICLVEPRSIGSLITAARNPPPSWQVSYLQHLLRPNFSDTHAKLEEEITRQRQLGRWASDDAAFHAQIQKCIVDQTLIAVVGKGGPSAQTDEGLAFPADDQPLEIAVLYTAAFYQDLSPTEFSRVLCTFLGDEKTLVPETIQQKTKKGFEEVQLKREKRLDEIWRQAGDPTLRKCGLITGGDQGRAVTFADLARRGQIRRHLDEHYGLYVQKQFLAAWDKELLFDESETVSKNVAAITIEMASSYPQQFGADWFFAFIVRRFAESEWWGADASAFTRMTTLLLETLREPKLDKIVPAVLEKLLGSGEHELAFNIAFKLRNGRGFDPYYWLKQLADRGSEPVRVAVYIFLRNELRRPGSKAFWLLHKLEPWLPDAAREPESYAPSQNLALHLVMEYALEVTAGFELAEYGKWPSRFPLLATDAQTAKDDFSLLVRWLLHPGMPTVMTEGSTEGLIRVMSALFSEWVFILLGSPEPGDDGAAAPMRREPAPAAAATDLSADDALSLLLGQILEMTVTRQRQPIREALLSYWEDMRNFLIVLPTLFVDLGRAHRRELAWKRNLIRRLITDFRRLQRELRPPRAQTATA